MRMTVTLDADVESMLRRAMRERGISFQQALNEAVRTGLQQPAAVARPYRLPVFPMGFRPEICLDKALWVAEALEDEEVARKPSVRK